ncbi:mechanosensitive ion channel family protein [Gloeothece citriformis]|nr:mechanosensitive ion channel family protein [Gloeothece citriformis]
MITWETPSSARQPIIRNIFTERVEFASVYLDGYPLFQIASQDVSFSDSEPEDSLTPLERRVERVERTLQKIITTDFDPKTLQVGVATLNNLTVIVASDQENLDQQVIVTVTELDAQIASSSVENLAQQWSQIIREALIKGWEARQPEARKHQLTTAGTILLAVIIISALDVWGQKWLKKRFSILKKRLQKKAPTSLKSKAPLSPDDMGQILPKPIILSSRFRQQANLQERLALNIMLQRFLQVGLIWLWFSGIAVVLYVFPETRLQGRDILVIPLKIVLIWVILTLIGNFILVQVNHRLKEWVEQSSIITEDSQRRVLRASTLLEVLRGMIKFSLGSIGIIWFLVWIEFPLNSVLTGAGILGAALTFVFQNLLRDWINGILIIFEDQYAVGDLIEYNGMLGIVENMSLRITQIRTLDGRLSTIPHNQITVAHNLTKDWSRVNFRIEVAYDSDPTVVIALMKQVAQEMAEDSDWQQDIIDPVSLIGVNRVAHSGIEIMMWIQVKRLRQLFVEQEFRRRLKLAFDHKGIQIGIPKQSLLFPENTQPLSDG